MQNVPVKSSRITAALVVNNTIDNAVGQNKTNSSDKNSDFSDDQVTDVCLLLYGTVPEQLEYLQFQLLNNQKRHTNTIVSSRNFDFNVRPKFGFNLGYH